MKTVVVGTGDLDTSIVDAMVTADVSDYDVASIQLDLFEDAAASTVKVYVSNTKEVWYEGKAVNPETGTLTAISVSTPGIVRYIQVTDVRYVGVKVTTASGGVFKVTICAASAN